MEINLGQSTLPYTRPSSTSCPPHPRLVLTGLVLHSLSTPWSCPAFARCRAMACSCLCLELLPHYLCVASLYDGLTLWLGVTPQEAARIALQTWLYRTASMILFWIVTPFPPSTSLPSRHHNGTWNMAYGSHRFCTVSRTWFIYLLVFFW